LRVRQAGLRVIYTPRSVSVRTAATWQPLPEQDRLNCFRFYARWTGSLWQDDAQYLAQDGLEHDTLSAIYRGLAARLAEGTHAALA
jgi:hypothetical protein